MKRRRYRGRFPREKQAKDASDVIAKVVDHYRLGKSVQERRVLTDWKELVGARIAERTWPGRLKDGVLPIRVSNSAWMHELSFMREDLLTRLRQRAEVRIESLRFYVGKPKREWRTALSAAEQARRKPVVLPPPPDIPPAIGSDLRRIELETESVDDGELREIILEARRRLNL